MNRKSNLKGKKAMRNETAALEAELKVYKDLMARVLQTNPAAATLLVHRQQEHGNVPPIPETRNKPRAASKSPKGETDWSKVEKTCPKCGAHGTVSDLFGVRLVRGIVRLQSWCLNCRATNNYHNKPRKDQR